MKRIALFITCSLASAALMAQNVGDCSGGIVICNETYSEVNAPVGFGSVQEFVGDCNFGISGESNSVWYIFSPQTAGNMGFVLTPNDLNDDYDWAVLNITNGGCGGINSMLSPVVSCNSFGMVGFNGPTGISTAQGGVGSSNGPGDLNGPAFNADLQVQPGQTYALCVMNWTGSPNGYNLDFSGSTASLFDQVDPFVTEAEINCTNTVVTVHFSENLLFNSVQAVDFQVVGPQGTVAVSTAISQGGSVSSWNLTLSQPITQPGSYQVVITDVQGFVTDGCGNQATQPFVIEIPALITYDLSASVACDGVNGSLTVSDIVGGEAPYSFSLNVQSQAELTVTGLDAGSYEVAVTDALGCTIPQTIEILPFFLSVNIPDQDSLTCITPAIAIEGLTITPQGSANFSWTTSVGNIASGANTPNPTVNAEGVYNVVATDSQTGCTGSGQVTVWADAEAIIDLSTLQLPNVFSPNNDNKNDFWRPYFPQDPEVDLGIFMSEMNLKIFNRWGQSVFESSKAPIQWKASDAEEGTYFVIFTYKSFCSGEDVTELTGTVVVKR